MKGFDGVTCDRCGAVLGFIPLFEIKKMIYTGYHKKGMVRKPSNPYTPDRIAYKYCLWCGSDFSKVIEKLNKAMELYHEST